MKRRIKQHKTFRGQKKTPRKSYIGKRYYAYFSVPKIASPEVLTNSLTEEARLRVLILQSKRGTHRNTHTHTHKAFSNIAVSRPPIAIALFIAFGLFH